jgi:hypothetical protein
VVAAELGEAAVGAIVELRGEFTDLLDLGRGDDRRGFEEQFQRLQGDVGRGFATYLVEGITTSAELAVADDPRRVSVSPVRYHRLDHINGYELKENVDEALS